jgi:hypothetical protein
MEYKSGNVLRVERVKANHGDIKNHEKTEDLIDKYVKEMLNGELK